MKQTHVLAVMMLVTLGAGLPASQAPPAPIEWRACLDQPAAWYAGAEAIRVADNVRLYQRMSGGWPKNIDMARVLTPTEVATVTDEKDLNDSTIDNGSTWTQLRYLARVFAATKAERFRTAFSAGLEYLFKAQYPNGGWPQYYPLRTNYSRYITFNDDAMVSVLRLLRDVSEGRAPFAFVEAPARTRASQAVARGVGVILKSQIRVQGTLTAWCAQHDEVTLEPRLGRAYEHPSISGRESVQIVRFLMTLPPTPALVAAIEGAVAWFRVAQVSGLRVVSRPLADSPHGRDVVVEKDPAAPPLWARFYEIGTNRPIFSDRDGVVRYSLAEIGIERRSGYSWYGPYAADLLARDYPAWQARR